MTQLKIHLSQHHHAAAPTRCRGPAAQQARRVAEHRARQAILACHQRMSHYGTSSREAECRLGLSSRTLRHWNHQARAHKLHPRTRGRPTTRSPRTLRNQLVTLLRYTGPGIGVPTLRAQFPTMPRSEIQDILRRFRRVWRKDQWRIIHRLRWHQPGAVWAADHLQPDQPIDDQYPYALVVRDLASHFQLAWLPVPDNKASSTIAILARLFQIHGPPLVLKTDNGSAFIARKTRTLLDEHQVLHLRSPARRPQYNGSCEAAGGSHRRLTNDQAALHCHRAWTSSDMFRSKNIRNLLGRPWGDRGPTPEELWRSRKTITSKQRQRLRNIVQRLQADETVRRGLNSEAPWGSAAQASIDRAAIRQALLQLGQLTVTRRLITPPIKYRRAASFA